MLAYIPGPELLDITTGDMIFVTIWAITSLVLIAAIYVYKMLPVTGRIWRTSTRPPRRESATPAWPV